MSQGGNANGVVSVPSRYDVNESLDRLLKALGRKGITVFAVVDHSGEAAKVGLTMPPTKLVIFGNPKAGTPLMLAAPTIALDLPLKVLIREEGGRTLLEWNSGAYLAERHGLPETLRGVLEAAAGLAAEAGA